MSLLKVTTAAIFLLYLTTVKATDIKTFYLGSDCRYKTAIIRAGDVYSGTNSSGILKSMGMDLYPSNAECTVKIQSGSVFEGILVTIRKIDFFSCDDSLKVEDSINLTETYCLDILDKMEEREFFSSGDMTVTLKTGKIGKSSNYKGFQLTFTSYRASYTGSSFCPSTGFECDNERCISSDLKCDEHNHCGDNSNRDCGLSPGEIAGVVCGTIFLVIAFIAGTVYICRKKQRTMTTTTTTHYPPPA